VESASFTLETKAGSQTALLDPSKLGVVEFYAVPKGDARLTATFNVDGETRNKSQVVAVEPAKPDPGPIEMVLEDAASAQSAEPAPPSTNEKEDDEKTAASTRGAGDVFAYIVSFGLIAGLGYFAFHYYRKNTKEVNAKLEQLGVQVPKDPADPMSMPASAPVVPKAPEPPQQIILDPVSSVSAASAAVAAMPMPKLVASSGVVIELPEGESILGRDDSADLAFPGESSVSRRHARIVRTGGSVEVEDLGSTNGTYINGARISAATPLSPGDSVLFGELHARYEV